MPLFIHSSDAFICFLCICKLRGKGNSNNFQKALCRIWSCWDASCMVGLTKHRTDKCCFALERFCLENLGAMLEYWYTKLSVPLVLLLCAIYCASIGHFRVTLCLCSTVSLCAKLFIWKWVDLHQNELVDRTHLHKNVFAWRLILTQR